MLRSFSIISKDWVLVVSVVVGVLLSIGLLFVKRVYCNLITITPKEHTALLIYIENRREYFVKLPNVNSRSVTRVVNDMCNRVNNARRGKDETELVTSLTFLQLSMLSDMLKMHPDRQLVNVKMQLVRHLQFIETKRSSRAKHVKVKCAKRLNQVRKVSSKKLTGLS
ncbi:MAG: hypothetical protein LBU29_04365 [Endomicrobium sp.]|jgi:hypothetical protein|nr:hypothetical protein [Endomicrobium sp.]